ncbi:MAG: NAD(P)/FAD-dependent oxidoreductase [Chloroflexota bacterium]|nr:NAD(P)/FAD-dependent oxidoreductase [Chloroflexota bacterium]
MTEKSVIIIGAGLAGLSAGCYAQMNGYRSHIFEHHTLPGGVAACWKRKGYLIDGGIHFVMGHRPGTALHEAYRELGIPQSTQFVDLTTYGRFIDEASGCSLDVTHDLDRLASDLKSISPADARAIDELISGARAMQRVDLSEMGMSKPPELAGRLSFLKDMWQMRRIFKYFSGKYAKPIEEYVEVIEDPWVRELIKNLFLPEVPAWFTLMILGLLSGGQLGLIEGGCLSFVLPIEKRYKSLGGQVTYKATVAKVLVENNRASGVRLTDGTEHCADAVISTADGADTVFKMLGGHYVNDTIKDRFADWKLCRPLLMISYGVTREFLGDPPFSTIVLKEPLTIGNQKVEGMMLRIFNYSSHFALKGKTVVQVEIESEWDYWNDLQNTDRALYDAEKERIAAEALNRLEKHYPGISSQVELTDVATPYTTWRYTLNQRGAWGGWLMSSELINEQVERTLPGLNDFYMAGQWVMPGGGVHPALYSGRHAVQLLCHRDKRRFVTAIP